VARNVHVFRFRVQIAAGGKIFFSSPKHPASYSRGIGVLSCG
jgi:hypothetical protein